MVRTSVKVSSPKEQSAQQSTILPKASALHLLIYTHYLGYICRVLANGWHWLTVECICWIEWNRWLILVESAVLWHTGRLNISVTVMIVSLTVCLKPPVLGGLMPLPAGGLQHWLWLGVILDGNYPANVWLPAWLRKMAVWSLYLP